MSLRIRSLRKAKGWTQEQLAAKANMSRSQLAMIEKETRTANTLRLNAIAKALGVTTISLYDSINEAERISQLLPDISPEDRASLVRMAEAFASRKD